MVCNVIHISGSFVDLIINILNASLDPTDKIMDVALVTKASVNKTCCYHGRTVDAVIKLNAEQSLTMNETLQILLLASMHTSAYAVNLAIRYWTVNGRPQRSADTSIFHDLARQIAVFCGGPFNGILNRSTFSAGAIKNMLTSSWLEKAMGRCVQAINYAKIKMRDTSNQTKQNVSLNERQEIFDQMVHILLGTSINNKKKKKGQKNVSEEKTLLNTLNAQNFLQLVSSIGIIGFDYTECAVFNDFSALFKKNKTFLAEMKSNSKLKDQLVKALCYTTNQNPMCAENGSCEGTRSVEKNDIFTPGQTARCLEPTDQKKMIIAEPCPDEPGTINKRLATPYLPKLEGDPIYGTNDVVHIETVLKDSLGKRLYDKEKVIISDNHAIVDLQINFENASEEEREFVAGIVTDIKHSPYENDGVTFRRKVREDIRALFAKEINLAKNWYAKQLDAIPPAISSPSDEEKSGPTLERARKQTPGKKRKQPPSTESTIPPSNTRVKTKRGNSKAKMPAAAAPNSTQKVVKPKSQSLSFFSYERRPSDVRLPVLKYLATNSGESNWSPMKISVGICAKKIKVKIPALYTMDNRRVDYNDARKRMMTKEVFCRDLDWEEAALDCFSLMCQTDWELNSHVRLPLNQACQRACLIGNLHTSHISSCRSFAGHIAQHSVLGIGFHIAGLNEVADLIAATFSSHVLISMNDKDGLSTVYNAFSIKKDAMRHFWISMVLVMGMNCHDYSTKLSEALFHSLDNSKDKETEEPTVLGIRGDTRGPPFLFLVRNEGETILRTSLVIPNRKAQFLFHPRVLVE